MWAPAGTPADVTARISASLNESLKSPAVRERFERIGLTIYGGSPDEFRAEIASRIRQIEALLAKGYKLR
jgi:tripartite-type tricarboxylate transporter receptor subunit TctC